jgi:hypothetical protein
MECLSNLLHPFDTGLLDAINIFGQKTFVDSNIFGHLRDVYLRKTAKNPCNLIVWIRLCGIVERGYMYIFIQLFPADVITKAPDCEIRRFFLYFLLFPKEIIIFAPIV